MHTVEELKELQALPLSIKVSLTKARIREWVNWYGINGVYVSFSGGKDSTVLLDIARKMYPEIKALFVDVPTQYPELKQFAMTFDNVDVAKPKISFAQVCEKYGFPLISKEVSESVEGARKYLKKLMEENSILTDRQTDRQIPYRYYYERVTGTGKYAKKENTPSAEQLANILNDRMVNRKGGNNQRLANMLGWRTKDKSRPVQVNPNEQDRSNFSLEKYKYFLEAPFDISNKCCNVMKKAPAYQYEKKTGRVGITAQMASESNLRTQKWLQNGCNAFDAKRKISNPMSFWLEQDVLTYIKLNNLKICSVYGEVVTADSTEVRGQLGLSDIEQWENLGIFELEKPLLKTTGCSRTGCVLCGFGCHLEKPEESRFVKLKESHPQLYRLLDLIKNNGYTMREAIEWINEHGNGVHIEL